MEEEKKDRPDVPRVFVYSTESGARAWYHYFLKSKTNKIVKHSFGKAGGMILDSSGRTVLYMTDAQYKAWRPGKVYVMNNHLYRSDAKIKREDLDNGRVY